jgi:hypothetical protein
VQGFNVGFEGGITIEAIRADYADVLALPDSTLITPEHGYVLPWLQWLLLEGNKTIIEHFKVQFGSWGRTGGAIMRKGGSWHVPPEHAGTINDNFITRAIAQIEPQLVETIKNVFN